MLSSRSVANQLLKAGRSLYFPELDITGTKRAPSFSFRPLARRRMRIVFGVALAGGVESTCAVRVDSVFLDRSLMSILRTSYLEKVGIGRKMQRAQEAVSKSGKVRP